MIAPFLRESHESLLSAGLTHLCQKDHRLRDNLLVLLLEMVSLLLECVELACGWRWSFRYCSPARQHSGRIASSSL